MAKRAGCIFRWSMLMVLIILSAANSGYADEDETKPETYAPGEYQLVFEDDFEAEGLDSEKWKQRYAEHHEYGAGFTVSDSIEQPGDGLLHLITRYQDGEFFTGMIRSVPEYRYGYFEARIRFQTLRGHHGAFWLQSETYGEYVGDPGRSGAEIDIIEFFGSGRTETDAQHNVYWDVYSGVDTPGKSHNVFYRRQHGEELCETFHIFALLWTPEAYIYFIDGLETWRTEVGISHVKQHIILSLTTSLWENGDLDSEQLPDEMLVDYVRVYQRM